MLKRRCTYQSNERKSSEKNIILKKKSNCGWRRTILNLKFHKRCSKHFPKHSYLQMGQVILNRPSQIF